MENLTPKVKTLLLNYGNNVKLTLDAGCGKVAYFDLFKNDFVGMDLSLDFVTMYKKKTTEKDILDKSIPNKNNRCH